MKRTRLLAGTMILGMFFLPSRAFAWGSATHAYIDDRLNVRWGVLNLNETYGGMTPDVFNTMFTSPYMLQMGYATHVEFMKVWRAAHLKTGKALAYGFVSHNDIWGADYTAHSHCASCDEGEGYVVVKGRALTALLSDQYQALDLTEEQAAEISQDLVEFGVDILMKRMDSRIGEKVSGSALLRSPEMPLLLVKAYGGEFTPYFGGYFKAVAAITSAESQFRQTTIGYGQALTQDEAAATQLISEQVAQVAGQLLEAWGKTPPSDLTDLIRFAIEQSILICQDDFKAEIRDTITFVDGNLQAKGISY